MTLLSRRDRETSSYLEIALAVADHGPRGEIAAELEQLFRRVAFNVLTRHRDDHLRNHGFIRAPEGWRLAPAFDLNPMPDMAAHELALDDSVHVGDVESIVETGPFYRLTVPEARTIVDGIRDTLAAWRSIAASADLGPVEMHTLADAIEA